MLIATALTGVLLLVPQAQQPPVPSGSAGVIEFDHLLPNDTLAVVSLRDLDSHVGQIARTTWPLLFRPVLDSLPRLASEMLPPGSDLDSRQLLDVLQRGWTLAWTGTDADGDPAWLLLGRTGLAGKTIAKALERKLESLQRSGVTARQNLWKEIGVWAVRAANGTNFAYAVSGQMLIVGSDTRHVEDVLARLHEPLATGKTLRDHDGYQAFCRRNTEGGEPFLSAFAQPPLLIEHVLACLPEATRPAARQVLSQLQLHTMREAGMSLRAVAGQIHQSVWLSCPGPHTGLLSALLGAGRRVDRNVARIIDPEATWASIHNIDLHTTYDSILSITSSFSQDLPNSVRGWLANVASRTGVSLKSDVLDLLNGEVVVQQWPSTVNAQAELVVMAQVRDAWRLNTGLGKLMRDMPARPLTILGNGGWSLSNVPLEGASAPCLVVAKDHLILATSQQSAKRAVRILTLPQPNPLERLLATADKMPCAIGWADVRRATRDFMSRVAARYGNPRAAEAIDDAIERLSGDMVSSTRWSDSGVSISTRSPVGDVYVSTGLSYALQTLQYELGIANTQATGFDILCTNVLLNIVSAQSLFKSSAAKDADRDGIGEFGTIDDLVKARCLSTPTIQAKGSDYYLNDYRLKVLLPRSVMGQELHFAVVAWPAEQKRGPVYAVTDQGTRLVNSILAASDGIDTFDVRELFVGGAFNTVLVEGWTKINATAPAQAATNSASPTPVPTTEEERKLYFALLQAERTRTISKEAIAALDVRNPALLARAAYTMGTLRIKDAVPQLCKLASSHADIEVRRQAMAALSNIRDPRSTAASLQALADIDVEVRTYAATNLGRLKDKKSVGPLLNVLAGTPERGGQDHVAALLALADIGESRCLMMAASSVKSPSLKVEEALTYLFQALSPSMAAKDEAKTLLVALGSKSTMLRRYAIQRLGVLKDPTTVVALDAHLANEDKQLQPLVLISLDAIRGTTNVEKPTGLGTLWQESLAKLRQKWKAMPRADRLMWLGGAVGLLFSCMLLTAWRIHVRRRRKAEAWAGMVAPSEGYSRPRPSSGLRHAVVGTSPVATPFQVHRRNVALRSGDDGYYHEPEFTPPPSSHRGSNRRPPSQFVTDAFEPGPSEVYEAEDAYQDYGHEPADLGYEPEDAGYEPGYQDDYYEQEDDGWGPVELEEQLPPPPPLRQPQRRPPPPHRSPPPQQRGHGQAPRRPRRPGSGGHPY